LIFTILPPKRLIRQHEGFGRFVNNDLTPLFDELRDEVENVVVKTNLKLAQITSDSVLKPTDL
jgi:hypothetical protein